MFFSQRKVFQITAAFSICITLTQPTWAVTCEESFHAEGDPRNGAEYFASKDIQNTSVSSALNQLSHIASADGFNVLGMELNATNGALTIEQSKGVQRPFLIKLDATKSSSGSNVTIQTRLNKGVTAQADDMRKNMCGMLNRVQSGEVGEKIAAEAATKNNANAATEITAVLLARDLFRMKKKVGGDKAGADVITARYKGQRFLLDGQVSQPIDLSDTTLLWYRTRKEPGFLPLIEDQNSILWAAIVCEMAPEHKVRALTLEENDWAKLSGTVSHYQLGTPDKLVLKGCKFF